MDENKLEKIIEIKRNIDKLDRAINLFIVSSPPSRVAVATGFRYSNNSLYELDLADEIEKSLRTIVLEKLTAERARLQTEFNSL